MTEIEIAVGPLADIDDPGCREFKIGEGDWPFRGFVVRQGDRVFAYQNFCPHAGHPMNWKPDGFLAKAGDVILCSSHGATFSIDGGECLGGPCGGKPLNSVTVEVRDGIVYVTGPVGR